MLKDFFVRKLIESKMKDVPQDQREMIIKMIEKNPEFFQKLVEEIQTEISSGVDQMEATMNVMKRHESKLKEIASS